MTCSSPYEFSKVDYNHPNAAYRSRTHVAVYLNVAGEELVAGASVEVA